MDPQKALRELRERAKSGRDPTCADETLGMLLARAKALPSGRYLEIGAGEGLSSIAVALESPLHIDCIEKDAARAACARGHIREFGLEGRIRLMEGDAVEILPCLAGEYDLIFLDGPKAQYLRYLPDCKRLLRRGGSLFSDDVLLYGWVRGEPPPKRRSLVAHIREYLSALEADGDLSTEIFEYGEGLAVSTKR